MPVGKSTRRARAAASIGTTTYRSYMYSEYIVMISRTKCLLYCLCLKSRWSLHAAMVIESLGQNDDEVKSSNNNGHVRISAVASRTIRTFAPHVMFGLASFWDRLQPPSRLTRDLLWGLVLGVTVSISSTTLALLTQSWRRKQSIAKIPPRPIEIRSEEVVDGVIGLIGGCAALIGRSENHGMRIYGVRGADGRKYTADTDQLAERRARR